MNENEWVVYLVRCADESLYCGITNNMDQRVAAHNAGKGAKYTQWRLPSEVVSVSSQMTKSDVLKLEHYTKRVPANRKISKSII
jgi:putative endonuclease